jgi:hypothetical protein
MHEEPQDDSSTPAIYQFKPENWLHRIHATADLGQLTMTFSAKWPELMQTKVTLASSLLIPVKRRMFYLYEQSSMGFLPIPGSL